ncbi:MAG: hypothetical protein IT302_01645 [Dehalococcoidia bacterium]|nr:hypothetical protein [Dehalococcoidia bacterium]
MGSRRLPRATTVASLALAVCWLAAACSGGGANAAATPADTPTAAAPTATATLPAPTPDPLASPPGSAEDAVRVLSAYLPGKPSCPPELAARWQAVCLAGNVDGDGLPDLVVAVPLQDLAAGQARAPGIIVVRRGPGVPLVTFPALGSIDLGPIGRPLFTVADRTGDGRDDVSYLATACGAHTCTSRLEIQAWDGTAWHDAGPGDGGIPTVDRAAITGTGTASEFVMHGGTIQSVGAGPVRTTTTTYRWDGLRFAAATVTPDPAVYLVHAIADADVLFAAGRYQEAATAYVAAARRDDLADWWKETGRGDGRAGLRGYALFRAAVATAAGGADATSAFDTAITGSTEQAFVTATEAFRKGFKEGGSLHAGCTEATRYLSSPGVPAYLRALFDYGYGNPQPTPAELCPL